MIRKYNKKIVQVIPRELRPGRKRISVDIPTSLHDQVLKASERSNCTITMYVIRSLRDRLSKEGISDI